MVRFFGHDEATSDEWLPCDHAVLDPDERPALHAKLAADGYPFGGDANGARVPDIQGRSPMGASSTLALGDAGGGEGVTLVADEIPSHSHQYGWTYGGATYPPNDNESPQVTYIGEVGHWYGDPAYTEYAGGDQAHENTQPSLVGRWMIYAGCVATLGGGTEGPTIGEVRAFSHATASPGWVACGTTPARADYPWLWALYAAAGYPWGAGDGSTTFGTPNPSGRVLVGDGTGSGLTARIIADAVGVETVELDHSELPEHYHELEIPAAYAEVTLSGHAGTNPAIAYIATTLSSGSSDPHENMAPTLALEHRVYGGSADDFPAEGVLGVMPEAVYHYSVVVEGNSIFMAEMLSLPPADYGVVLFLYEAEETDTYAGLSYYQETLEEYIEIPDARIAVVEYGGQRLHVLWIGPRVVPLAGASVIVDWSEATPYVVGQYVLCSGVGMNPPTVATASGATNPVGPTIAVTDATIAVLGAIGAYYLEPTSETEDVINVERFGASSATVAVASGNYAATWVNPDNYDVAAAVVLIPRRLVP
jgi:microcystin-dependent protein